jgi:hypothetical protein
MLYKTSIILILFSAFTGISQKKSVRIDITYSQPYCGGAKPTKEMEAEAAKERPYTYKKIVVVSESGKANTLKTDKTGSLKMNLLPGNYKLYEAWRYYKRTPSGYTLKDLDTTCLKVEWQHELYTVVVTKNDVKITPKATIVLFCPWAFPCLLESAKTHLPQ